MYPAPNSGEQEPRLHIGEHYAQIIRSARLDAARPSLRTELQTNRLSRKLFQAAIEQQSRHGAVEQSTITQYTGLLAELFGKTNLYDAAPPQGWQVQNLHALIAENQGRLRRDFHGFKLSKNNAILVPHPNPLAIKPLEIDAALICTNNTGQVVPVVAEFKITTSPNEVQRAMRQQQIDYLLNALNKAYGVDTAVYILALPADAMPHERESVQNFIDRGNIYAQMPVTRQEFTDKAMEILV